jgi:hypothetical protein
MVGGVRGDTTPTSSVKAVGTSIPGLFIAAFILAIGTPAYLMVAVTSGEPSQLLWLAPSGLFVAFALFFVGVAALLIVTADENGLTFHSPLLRRPIGFASGEALRDLAVKGRRLRLPEYRNRLLFMFIWTNARALDDSLQQLKQRLPEMPARTPPTMSPRSAEFIMKGQRTWGKYGAPILFVIFFILILAVSDSLGPAGTARALGGLLAGTGLYYVMRRIWIQKIQPRWTH